ncbi:hypothetical protein GGQ84_002312 [Desulfitispora alkaliphila]|uniref:DUF4349 domain-containing protein n=1 Tax=Desulfitispora alkaliphila TaxID=622674 RepID=UPI003D250450
MSCEKTKELLSPYIDGVLSEDERLDIEDHLASCVSCQEELEDLQAIINMTKTLPPVEPPLEFRSQLKEKLNREAGKGRTDNKHKYMPVVGLLAVACLMLFVVATTLNVNPLTMGGMGSDSYNRTAYESAPEDAPRASGQSRMGTFDNMAVEQELIEERGLVNEAETSSQKQTREESMERKVIRRAYVALEATSYGEVNAKIEEMAMALNGYIQDVNRRVDNQGITRGNLVLRVPQANFDKAISMLEEMGKINSINISDDDVSVQYYDTEARLKVLYTQEERLIELVQGAQNIEELIQVETELGRIRGEIESLESRIRYLSQQVNMSTINVEIVEPTTATARITAPDWSNIVEDAVAAFIMSINKLINYVSRAIIAVIGLLPLAIVSILVLYGAWRYYKKRRISK